MMRQSCIQLQMILIVNLLKNKNSIKYAMNDNYRFRGSKHKLAKICLANNHSITL